MPKGPTKYSFNIKVRRCFDCDYHHHCLVVGGRDSEYAHYCKHESFVNDILPALKGRYIGKDDKTPEWCPVVNKV